MWTFVWEASQSSPQDSDLRVLPLIAFAEHYRARRDKPRAWPAERAMRTAFDLYDGGWFDRVRKEEFPPIVDLSHVAHALLAGNQLYQAGRVFEAMGGYRSTMPWSLFGDPAEEIHRAMARCGMAPY
jgi:hypothetical protein